MLDRTTFLRTMVPEAGVAQRRRDPASGFSFQVEQAEAEGVVQQSSKQHRASHPLSSNQKWVTVTPTASTRAVPAFESWFQTVKVNAAEGSAGGYTMRRANCASEAGAAEALRLVQRFAPGARVEPERFGGSWATDKPLYHIALPGGERMNAGLILDHYYQHGAGPHGLSDADLASEIRLLMGEDV